MQHYDIFTWHIHGSYLAYLAIHSPHRFYIPVKEGRPEGYGGKCGQREWPENILEIPAEDVRRRKFDCILFQSRKNYEDDQYEILSAEQRRLPKVFLEHDPPRKDPTDTHHPVNDPSVLLVHVTHFNQLMWDSGMTPTVVIEHGVTIPEGVVYTGERAQGLTVVNGLRSRGRRLGLDIFQRVREEIPLQLVGMGSESLGGLGEVEPSRLSAFEARYRFFFNPIRYTSLGLAVCEAMLVGMPIVGLATTEMTTVIENGHSGYLSTNVEELIVQMQRLIDDRQHAVMLGARAREVALERFNIERFTGEWNTAFHAVAGLSRRAAAGAGSAITATP